MTSQDPSDVIKYSISSVIKNFCYIPVALAPWVRKNPKTSKITLIQAVKFSIKVSCNAMTSLLFFLNFRAKTCRLNTNVEQRNVRNFVILTRVLISCKQSRTLNFKNVKNPIYIEIYYRAYVLPNETSNLPATFRALACPAQIPDLNIR